MRPRKRDVLFALVLMLGNDWLGAPALRLMGATDPLRRAAGVTLFVLFSLFCWVVRVPKRDEH